MKLDVALNGQLLDKYVVKNQINQGKFGKIFKIKEYPETQQGSTRKVLKLQSKYKDLAYEIKFLKKVNKYMAKFGEHHNLPEIYDYGMV